MPRESAMRKGRISVSERVTQSLLLIEGTVKRKFHRAHACKIARGIHEGHERARQIELKRRVERKALESANDERFMAEEDELEGAPAKSNSQSSRVLSRVIANLSNAKHREKLSAYIQARVLRDQRAQNDHFQDLIESYNDDVDYQRSLEEDRAALEVQIDKHLKVLERQGVEIPFIDENDPASQAVVDDFMSEVMEQLFMRRSFG